MKKFLLILTTVAVMSAIASCGGKKNHSSIDVMSDDSVYETITLIPYQTEGGKWGYVDTDGKIRIDGKFDAAHDFSEELAAVKMGNLWGYINSKGDFAIPLSLEQADNFAGGRAKVRKKGYVGFINHKGGEVIKCQFDEIGNFENGEAYAVYKGKKGIIDGNGSPLLELKYDEITPFNDYLLLLKIDRGYGLASINTKQEILSCDYLVPGYPGQYTDSEGNGYIFFKGYESNSKYGLMKETGEIIFKPKYDDHSGIGSTNLVCVWLNGELGYINLSGEEIIPVKYLKSEELDTRYILKTEDNRYCLADKSDGNIITGDRTYEEMRRFNDNLIYVEDFGSRSGWIDYNGNTKINCDYNYRSSGDFIYLDKRVGDVVYYGLAKSSDGELLVECDRYTNMADFSERQGLYSEVRTNHRHSLFPVGLINSNGKEVLPCNYMYIYNIHDGMARVKDMDAKIYDVRLSE